MRKRRVLLGGSNVAIPSVETMVFAASSCILGLSLQNSNADREIVKVDTLR